MILVGVSFTAPGSVAVSAQIAFIAVVVFGQSSYLLAGIILQGNAVYASLSGARNEQGFAPVARNFCQRIVCIVVQSERKTLRGLASAGGPVGRVLNLA